jgi:phosphatidylethanolamine/phosphatidyl-N-methylethanolamine N-methyltransferase
MPIELSDVVLAYRRYAPWYDTLYGAVLAPGRKALTARVRSLAPGRLLEVGVGTGLTLADYPAASQIVGVDVSSEMLGHAQQRVAALPGRHIELLEVNGESLPFEAESFDCVTLPYVLSVTPDPARLLQELHRVCRPGGTILVLNHFSGSRGWALLERAVSPLAKRIGFRSDFDYQEHIVDRGLNVRSVQTVNLFGLSKLVELARD